MLGWGLKTLRKFGGSSGIGHGGRVRLIWGLWEIHGAVSDKENKEKNMNDDRPAIEEAVKTYLDGIFEGDVEKLLSVFHATSSLGYEANGVFKSLPRDEWLEAIRGRASAKSRGLERHDEILQIDQFSPTTAMVKLKCWIPPKYFTDYLCFLKAEGKWQVTQKVFFIEVDNDWMSSCA